MRFLALAILSVAARALLADPFVAIHYESPWLVIRGEMDPVVSGTTNEWIAAREAFIRGMVARNGHRCAQLPVVYTLDANFVEAARARRSIAVVDDCAEILCGVASTEMVREWELADVRHLFTDRAESRLWREAQATAILGHYAGESVDVWLGDLVRAGLVPSIRTPHEDERVLVPLYASLIRFVDPGLGRSTPEVRQLIEQLSADEEARWRHGVTTGRQIRRAALLLPIRGATLSVLNRIDSHFIASASRDEIARLKRVGFDTVALIPFAGQRGFAASDLRRFDQSPASETDLSLLLAAARIRKEGMRVMFKPHVWVMREGDPTRIEASDWPAWFSSYRSYIIHQALLARAAGAAWFSVGTELSRSEHRPEWRDLIDTVRAIFPGGLTYAANFDAVERTPFFDRLDAIGVDAYFPLAPDAAASDQELRRGAERIVDRLEQLAKRHGRPVLLTELGYSTASAPWIEPWRERRGAAVDAADQARAFEAMLGAVAKSRAIAGFIIWKYESDPAHQDPGGFHPKGKAAERVISRYLR